LSENPDQACRGVAAPGVGPEEGDPSGARNTRPDLSGPADWLLLEDPHAHDGLFRAEALENAQADDVAGGAAV
jgi:hypothetical protein